MDLILWRHAEAREADEQGNDLDRPLTGKGERQARRMGEWLNTLLPESTRVLCSPALRARQTAEGLERKYRIKEELAPGGSVESLLMAARWPDAREAVLVVGHQDTLGLTASYLLTGSPQPWTVRKGAIWWLRGRDREGQTEIVLQTVLSPDRL